MPWDACVLKISAEDVRPARALKKCGTCVFWADVPRSTSSASRPGAYLLLLLPLLRGDSDCRRHRGSKHEHGKWPQCPSAKVTRRNLLPEDRLEPEVPPHASARRDENERSHRDLSGKHRSMPPRCRSRQCKVCEEGPDRCHSGADPGKERALVGEVGRDPIQPLETIELLLNGGARRLLPLGHPNRRRIGRWCDNRPSRQQGHRTTGLAVVRSSLAWSDLERRRRRRTNIGHVMKSELHAVGKARRQREHCGLSRRHVELARATAARA